MTASLRRVAVPALLIAAICLLPQIGVLAAALSGTFDTLRGLAETVLWRYTSTTFALVLLVGAGTVLIGTGAAWLVVTKDFPLRRLLEVLLVLPLAFPAYVLAYAYTDVLDHPGIVQTSLRAVTGWGPRDYWFPEIRSLGGAAAMLTLVLYPYVYLLARASFLQQAATPYYAALSLGQSPWRAFLRVSLPMARPAIAAGALLAVMETIADFGTVAHFGVQTFATGIYTSWFSMADRAAAAQLALGLLAFALLVAALERARRGSAHFAGRGRAERFVRQPLRGASAWGAMALCAVPVVLGVVIPVIALSVMATSSEQTLFSARYAAFITNSLQLGVIAAVVTVGAAVLLGSYHRLAKSHSSRAALAISRVGYAVPGGVIAVGLLVPFAGFDNWVDARMEAWFGISTGLLITGSIWLMICAYLIRFLAAAIGAYEGGLETVTGNVDAAARVLGRGSWGMVRDVHLPILRRSLLTALLIVFVDTIKELPATLILRPFNFDTLAVQAFRLASDERLNGAAVPSLVIAAIGLVPVILLCLQISERRLPGTSAAAA
ncbi:MAG: iron ABC transporter permease [Pseudomonadota bacterium]